MFRRPPRVAARADRPGPRGRAAKADTEKLATVAQAGRRPKRTECYVSPVSPAAVAGSDSTASGGQERATVAASRATSWNHGSRFDSPARPDMATPNTGSLSSGRSTNWKPGWRNSSARGEDGPEVRERDPPLAPRAGRPEEADLRQPQAVGNGRGRPASRSAHDDRLPRTGLRRVRRVARRQVFRRRPGDPHRLGQARHLQGDGGRPSKGQDPQGTQPSATSAAPIPRAIARRWPRCGWPPSSTCR